MQFESLEAFFQMGGYGAFVFGVYGLGIVTVAWNLVLPVMQQRRLVRANDVREGENKS